MDIQQQVREEQEMLRDVFSRFATTHVEDILQQPYVKLALNKLRWVPIQMGFSHYRLPEMPLSHYIQMAESMEEHITKATEFDLTVFYRILAARNIMVLLEKAYDFNKNVKDFYDLPLDLILDPVTRVEIYMSHANLTSLFRRLSINEKDTMKTLAHAIRQNLDFITEFWDERESIGDILVGPNDKLALNAYELYRVFFSICFARRLPEICSEEHLNEQYHTTSFWIDFESQLVLGIYACEGG